MLNLLAFFTHQILELIDLLYQKCRAGFSSRKELRNQIRYTFRFMVFESREIMVEMINVFSDFFVSSKQTRTFFKFLPDCPTTALSEYFKKE